MEGGRIMARRRTCAYCKAVKMNYDTASNKDNGTYQVGCQLGYKLQTGPEYIHRGSTRDSFVNNLYPCENCPKPTTLIQYSYLFYNRHRGAASGEL